ncbi:MAG: hypothetical protein FWF83_05685 [Clostridiales bacterium]|nr:hypothetical protein [Clostridiales bacterium]
MTLPNRILLTVVCVLLVLISVLVYLNNSDAALKRALQENRQFLLKVDGETAAVVHLQDILDCKPERFTTRLSSTTMLPRDVDFEGVELRLLYAFLGMDIPAAALFHVRGLDGYFSPISATEVTAENKIYICISMDGEILQAKSAGGWGPFMLVIRDSAFAQRWCKYVEEIDARQLHDESP